MKNTKIFLQALGAALLIIGTARFALLDFETTMRTNSWQGALFTLAMVLFVLGSEIAAAHLIHYYNNKKEEEAMKALAALFIPLADLPEGDTKAYLTGIAKAPTAQIWVVAKEAENGTDWAAYHGHPDMGDLQEAATPEDAAYLRWYATHTTTPDDTFRFGDKLSEAEAKALFKGEPWDALPYRP